MTFYEWMINRHLGKDTVAGDLAGDMRITRSTFPRQADAESEENRQKILNYLILRGACRECIAVFKRCWNAYSRHEKRSKGP